jgi:hypothetical protein
MPSKSPAKAKFMAAVAHGWKPDRVAAPPMKVAKEFNAADAGTNVRKKKRKVKDWLTNKESA